MQEVLYEILYTVEQAEQANDEDEIVNCSASQVLKLWRFVERILRQEVHHEHADWHHKVFDQHDDVEIGNGRNYGDYEDQCKDNGFHHLTVHKLGAAPKVVFCNPFQAFPGS